VSTPSAHDGNPDAKCPSSTEEHRPDGRKATQEAPVRKPGIEELGNALARGDRGKADTVSDVSLRTDDAEVARRRPDSGPLQAQS
jgi:hypothetical protein